MKKTLTLILLLLCAGFAYSQSPMACCGRSATAKFASLAADPKFVKAHISPVKFYFQSNIATAITYKTGDGKTATAYEWRAKTPTNNYLLVIHEYWGLNDQIKREAEKLFTDLGNTNVLALDLYDGKVSADKNEAAKLMQAVKEDRAIAIIKGALAYTGSKAKIATIGWCFGGGWSLQTSLLAGKQAIGCVMYYGMPEQDVNKLKNLNADVLGVFGNQDQWINPKVVAKFADDMKAAGKKLSLHQYNADHAFANPSNPKYNVEATNDAYTYTLAFLKARLK